MTVASLPWLLAALLVGAAHYVAEPIRWRIYGGRNGPPTALLFHIFNIASFVSYALPFKLGTPARLYLLRTKAKLSYEAIVALAFVDGGIYMIAWILAALAVGPSSLPPGSPATMLAVLLVAVVGLVVLGWALRRRNLRRAAMPRRDLRVVGGLRQLIATARSVSSKQLIAAMGIVLCDVIGQGLRHCLLLRAVDAEATSIVAFSAGIVSVACGLVSMLPMGIAGYDLMLVYLLSANNVPLATAIEIPLLNRGLSLSLGLILGAWSAWRLRITIPSIARDSSTGRDPADFTS